MIAMPVLDSNMRASDSIVISGEHAIKERVLSGMVTICVQLLLLPGVVPITPPTPANAAKLETIPRSHAFARFALGIRNKIAAVNHMSRRDFT